MNDKLIIAAAQFAEQAHEGQLRKGGEPYINHPMRVAGWACLAGDAGPGMVASAWLHDVVEDTHWTLPQISDLFGGYVSHIVAGVTNVFTKERYPKLNRAERKVREIERLSKVRHEAQTIKVIDRYDNLNTLPNDDFAPVYLQESILLLDAMVGADWKWQKKLRAKIQQITDCGIC